MRRCIQLAKNGLGTTYPNPLVGSVIVVNDKIIGEGWHYKTGSPHAEVNAIDSVLKKDLLKKATIYVSLEPCSHFGKTPPCADLIVASGIKKVVIGSLDPNPQVAGRGIKKLMDAGCEIITGVLDAECMDMNKRFFTFHQKKRPYIFLKWAETLDHFISPQLETRTEVKPVWITNPYSRQMAHKMRASEMAILVGTNTVLQDNPSLTTRNWGGSNPIRIMIDREMKLPSNSAIFDGEAKTIVFVGKDNIKQRDDSSLPQNPMKTYIEIDFSKDIAAQVCDSLYNHGIQSLIVEGGSKTLKTFIEANLWDEAFIFSGNTKFGQGIAAPLLIGDFVKEQKLKEDSLKVLKNLHSQFNSEETRK